MEEHLLSKWSLSGFAAVVTMPTAITKGLWAFKLLPAVLLLKDDNFNEVRVYICFCLFFKTPCGLIPHLVRTSRSYGG